MVVFYLRLTRMSKERWLSQTDAQKAWRGMDESWWVGLMDDTGEELKRSQKREIYCAKGCRTEPGSRVSLSWPCGAGDRQVLEV